MMIRAAYPNLKIRKTLADKNSKWSHINQTANADWERLDLVVGGRLKEKQEDVANKTEEDRITILRI